MMVGGNSGEYPVFEPGDAAPERLKNLITQKAIRRGSFRKVKELVANIKRFVKAYNPKANPFVWTATADSILKKIERLCKYISGTRH